MSTWQEQAATDGISNTYLEYYKLRKAYIDTDNEICHEISILEQKSYLTDDEEEYRRSLYQRIQENKIEFMEIDDAISEMEEILNK